jgi:hypothetical protein
MPILVNLPTQGVLFAGDTVQIEVVVEEEGVPVPLTGYDAIFTAKLSKDDADNAPTTIQKTLADGIEFTDEPNGVILVTLAPEDTTNITEPTTYFWDLQISIDDENLTVAAGTITFEHDVTQL